MGETSFIQRERGGVDTAVSNSLLPRILDLPSGQSVAIIGAPGSGKTTLLMEIVAAKVQQGISPDNIVVLSPNRIAAGRLRNALGLRLGIPTNGALARTPGSLAFALAQVDALDQGTDLPRLLTGSEQDSIIAELIAGDIAESSGPVWPDPLVPEVRGRRAFRSELRDLFARATEMGWDAAELAAQGTRREHPEWVAAAQFWSRYQQVVASYRFTSFDSSELLAIAATALRNPAVMPDVQLVLVDDAQELTRGAIRMLAAFAQRGVPVIAAGDPDITSTSFRGAVPEFLGRFATELGIPEQRASTVYLEEVYRHGPTIRQAVQKMTAGPTAEAGPQRKAVSVVENQSSTPLSVIERGSRIQETTALALHLRQHHVMGSTPWSAMAVVVRNSSLVPQVARALAVAEVPTRTLLSEQSIAEHPAALDLVAALSVAMGRLPLTPNTVTDLLTSPIVGLTSLEVRRVRMALRREELATGGNRTGEELLSEALRDPTWLITLDFGPARRVARFAETLQMLQRQWEAGDSIEELLWCVWERSGLASQWSKEALSAGLAADDANRKLDGVMALFTSAKRFVERYPDRPATEYIAELLEADVPEDTLAPQALQDAVLVCTASALIGAEYEVVAVGAVQENTWPNLRPRGSLLHAQDLYGDSVGLVTDFAAERQSVLHDERRMFSLALSRARRSVIVSATANEDMLPSPFVRVLTQVPGATADVHAQRHGLTEYPLTLRGMAGSLRRELTRNLASDGQSERTQQISTALSKLSAQGVPGADPSHWYGLTPPSTSEPLRDLTDDEVHVSVSPSKLETWEKNQLAWFIESVVGRTSSSAQGIGTIVHKVMEDAGNNPELPIDADTLWAQVDHRWHELSFDAEWLSNAERKRVRKMVAALSEYLQNFRHDGQTLLGSEGGFTLDVGKARVRGYIDRIEQDAVGQVVIVDLKTGKKFPSAKDVPEHAQLACYQLALHSGVIDGVPEGATHGGAKLLYVTDGVKGKLYREIIQTAYDDAEFERIRQRIEEAAVGMAGGSFAAPVVIKEALGDPHSWYEMRIHTAQAVSAS